MTVEKPEPWDHEALEGIRVWASKLNGDDKQASSDMRFLATIAARDEEIKALRVELSFFARKCKHGDPLPDLSSGWCWCERGMRAEARVTQLEAALRYYANPKTYETHEGELVMDDMGNLGDGTFGLGATARAALNGTP
jgi:hypothetical protein